MSARNFYIMQSAVAPMQSELPCYTPLTNHRTEVHTVPLVMAADYAALEAECERLRDALERATKLLSAAAGYATKMEPMPAKLLNAIDAELDASTGQEVWGE